MLLFILSPASSSYSGCLLYSCCCSLYSITLQENNWISRPTSREVEREIEKGRRNSSGNWTRNQSDTHSVKSSSHLFSKKRKIKEETNLEGDGWRSTRSKSFSTVSMTDTKQRGPRCTNICISLSLSVFLTRQIPLSSCLLGRRRVVPETEKLFPTQSSSWFGPGLLWLQGSRAGRETGGGRETSEGNTRTCFSLRLFASLVLRLFPSSGREKDSPPLTELLKKRAAFDKRWAIIVWPGAKRIPEPVAVVVSLSLLLTNPQHKSASVSSSISWMRKILALITAWQENKDWSINRNIRMDIVLFPLICLLILRRASSSSSYEHHKPHPQTITVILETKQSETLRPTDTKMSVISLSRQEFIITNTWIERIVKEDLETHPWDQTVVLVVTALLNDRKDVNSVELFFLLTDGKGWKEDKPGVDVCLERKGGQQQVESTSRDNPYQLFMSILSIDGKLVGCGGRLSLWLSLMKNESKHGKIVSFFQQDLWCRMFCVWSWNRRKKHWLRLKRARGYKCLSFLFLASPTVSLVKDDEDARDKRGKGKKCVESKSNLLLLFLWDCSLVYSLVSCISFHWISFPFPFFIRRQRHWQQ